ncbi:hypothetical protein F5Y05DRAFT_78153 [Hypoxylon sp. FL0543]|nr:hypothetical protein F5Y05DRAFT_78153 [Hypoxylon sp. FL0543]
MRSAALGRDYKASIQFMFMFVFITQAGKCKFTLGSCNGRLRSYRWELTRACGWEASIVRCTSSVFGILLNIESSSENHICYIYLDVTPAAGAGDAQTSIPTDLILSSTLRRQLSPGHL